MNNAWHSAGSHALPPNPSRALPWTPTRTPRQHPITPLGTPSSPPILQVHHGPTSQPDSALPTSKQCFRKHIAAQSQAASHQCSPNPSPRSHSQQGNPFHEQHHTACISQAASKGPFANSPHAHSLSEVPFFHSTPPPPPRLPRFPSPTADPDFIMNESMQRSSDFNYFFTFSHHTLCINGGGGGKKKKPTQHN